MRAAVSGKPTLVDYPHGDGHIIASGLTWEYSYNTNLPFAIKAYPDLMIYALRVAQGGFEGQSVLYDGNGATTGLAPVDEQVYPFGATVAVLGNTGRLVRTGYTFSGWNTHADGSGMAFRPGDTFAIGDQDVTLYADWTRHVNIISFPELTEKTYGDADFSPGATASSGLPVQYSSSNEAVAMIVNNQVRLVGSGSAIITASQAGNDDYPEATYVSRHLTVHKKTLTIGGSLLVSDKTYDGTAEASLTRPQDLLLQGIVGSDSVSLNPVAAFTDKNAAPAKAVFLTDATSLAGADKAHYSLSLDGAPAGSAEISPRPLSLSGFTADSKVYDGTTAVSGTGFTDDRLAGDELTFHYQAAFLNADVGQAKTVQYSQISIGGPDGGNYALSQATGTATADITPRLLTITLQDKSKTYGQTDPDFDVIYAGFVDGEGPETLGDVSIYRVTGEQAGTYDIRIYIRQEKVHNYTISEVKGTFTISPKSISLINRQAEDKVYDGGVAAVVSATLSGVLADDEVELVLTDARFADKNVGTDKLVSVQQSLSGTHAHNYVLITEEPFASAEITRRPLEVYNFRVSDRVYNGSIYANSYGFSHTGVATDSFLFFAHHCYFESKHVGENKNVRIDFYNVQGADAHNYQLITTSLSTTASITPLTLTVSGAHVEDKVYDGNNTAIISGAQLVGSLSGDDVVLEGLDHGQFPQKDIGSDLTVPAELYLTGADSNNYLLEQPALNTASILPRTLTVGDVSSQDKVYDGTDLAPLTGARLTGVLDNEEVWLLNGDLGLFDQADVGSNLVVTSQMSLDGQDAGNYLLEQPVLANASIVQRPLTITADDKQKTYGQIDPVFTLTSDSFAPGESIQDLDGRLSIWRQTGEAVGEYEIRIASDLHSDNYAITIVNGKLRINKKDVMVTGAQAQEKVYDGTTLAVVTGGLLDGVLTDDVDQVTLAHDGSGLFAQTGVGNGIAVQTSMTLTGSKAGQYNLIQPELMASITPRLVTVTAANQSKTYGEDDPDLGFSVTGGSVVDGDLFSGSLERVSGEDVGGYSIGQGTLTLGDNYNLTVVPGILTISQRAITVTAEDKNKTYGEDDPDLSYTVTGSVVDGDLFSGSLERVSGEDAGSYSIGAGTLTLGDNYNLTVVPGTLAISQRAVTVTAADQSKTYGEDDPELTWQLTLGRLVGDDTASGSLSRESGEDVGTYAMVQGSLDFGDNYMVTFESADLEIGRRVLSIQPVASGKVYGETDPVLTANVLNLASWDDDTVVHDLTLSREQGEAAGNYAIEGTGATADNYIIDLRQGTFTITQRPLTVTADVQAKTYGTADPELTWQITSGSLVGRDTLSGLLGREPGENVGSYSIGEGTLTAGGNYQVNFSSADLTITPYFTEDTSGSVRNGNDTENGDDLIYIADAAPGFGFAYWSDGSTLFSTQPELWNPQGGIGLYHPVNWPVTDLTDKKIIPLAHDTTTTVPFLGGEVRMVLPAHADPEAVIAVTPFQDPVGLDQLPAGMAAVPRSYWFQRSENLAGQRIRVEIDLALAGIDLSDAEKESLALYHWDEENQVWEELSIASQGVDIDAGILWAELDHFSTFGLFYAAEDIGRTGEHTRQMAWPFMLLGAGLAVFLMMRRRLGRTGDGGQVTAG